MSQKVPWPPARAGSERNVLGGKYANCSPIWTWICSSSRVAALTSDLPAEVMWGGWGSGLKFWDYPSEGKQSVWRVWETLESNVRGDTWRPRVQRAGRLACRHVSPPPAPSPPRDPASSPAPILVAPQECSHPSTKPAALASIQTLYP